jgi:hypothetical protein
LSFPQNFLGDLHHKKHRKEYCLDPTRIEDYILLDGYTALAKVLFDMTSEEVIREITEIFVEVGAETERAAVFAREHLLSHLVGTGDQIDGLCGMRKGEGGPVSPTLAALVNQATRRQPALVVGEIEGVEGNYQRRRVHRLAAPVAASALRVTVTATNGLDHARICEVRAYS